MCLNSLSLSWNLEARHNSFRTIPLTPSHYLTSNKLTKHIELVVEIAYILIPTARSSEFSCSHKGEMKLNIEADVEYCKLFNISHAESANVMRIK